MQSRRLDRSAFQRKTEDQSGLHREVPGSWKMGRDAEQTRGTREKTEGRARKEAVVVGGAVLLVRVSGRLLLRVVVLRGSGVEVRRCGAAAWVCAE